jgi:hypothetical protein
MSETVSTPSLDTLYDVHPEPEETFWYWMRERQAIYQRREIMKQPGPWTDDPILRQYAFCNVFREQDKVTVWVRENIRERWANHPNLWLMLAIARTINWPPTLARLIEYEGAWPKYDASCDEFNPMSLGNALDNLKDEGAKIYTGAYMIRAESDKNKHWYHWTKQQYIGRVVIGKLWEARDEFSALFHGGGMRPSMQYPRQPSLQEVHAWFAKFHGWGPFMAYEVVTDLRHTRYLRNAPDIMTWANAGPGAIRGLKRMMPNRRLRTPEDFNTAMQELLARSRENLPSNFPALEMRDIEHTLCEFDKHARVKHGEGRPRSMFHAGKAWL